MKGYSKKTSAALGLNCKDIPIGAMVICEAQINIGPKDEECKLGRSMPKRFFALTQKFYAWGYTEEEACDKLADILANIIPADYDLFVSVFSCDRWEEEGKLFYYAYVLGSICKNGKVSRMDKGKPFGRLGKDNWELVEGTNLPLTDIDEVDNKNRRLKVR